MRVSDLLPLGPSPRARTAAGGSAARRSPLERAAILYGAAWLGVAVIVTALTPGDARSGDWLGNLAFLVPIVLAVAALAAATRRSEGHARVFHASFASFALLSLAGSLIWVVYDLQHGHSPSSPSPADAVMLAAYLGLLPAIVDGLRPLGGLRISVTTLDAAVVTAALAFAVYALLLSPLLAHQLTLERLTAAAYPVLDLLALTIFLPLVLGRRTAPPGSAFALTSDRVYRPALPLDDALDILRQGRTSQFDPTVLDAFFTALPDLLALRARHPDVDWTDVVLTAQA